MIIKEEGMRGLYRGFGMSVVSHETYLWKLM
jgi:hypothetical protein